MSRGKALRRSIGVSVASLAALLLFGLAGTAAGAKPKLTVDAAQAPKLVSTFTAVKSASGSVAQTDPSLLGQTSAKPVNVMIKYDYDATASYTGGVSGLAATSPRVTGKKLRDNQAAVTAYDHYTAGLAQHISGAIQSQVPNVTIRQTFNTAYGGVEAQVPANQIGNLLKINGVAAVQKDALQQPQDDNTGFLGATNVWPSLGGSTKAGSNVIVGLLDTGVWPESPFFADNGLPAPPGHYACQFGGLDPLLGPAFTCNNKLIGAYDFTQNYMATVGSDGQEFCDDLTLQCSARDSEGHGTHTATTAAGDCVSTALLYGVNRGPVCGIAPGAHVIEYRVCMSQGCFNSDSVAAVQQAITDGVNVINFSVSGGAQPYTDPVELAFLDAFNAGISVNASAGNSGPGAGTSDHGGPWVTTVGASTGPRSFTSTLHLTGDGGATFDVAGVTLTKGITTPTPVVLAQNIPGEDALCQTALTAGQATGEVVLCERGTNARISKGYNVLQGGAAGMILYNPVQEDTESDNHWLPAIQIDGPPDALLAFVNGHTNVKATWAQGSATPAQADVMAAFSSRGPSGGDVLKPDVTAPGVQVLAGMTPQPDQTDTANGTPGNLFQAIAGTSMSSPHAAGVSALVKAAHPDWDPAEIKSALMTSSVQDVVKEDGTTPATPFDDGAGSIRADRAVSPTLVFDENYADYVAAQTDVFGRLDLNIPSVDAPTMTGQITTKRTAINVSGRNLVLDVSTQAPAGSAITIAPAGRFEHHSHFGPGPSGANRLFVPAGGTVSFFVTISGATLVDGQYFGRINLTPEGGGTPVTLPVAFYHQQGAVTLTHTCDQTTIVRNRGRAHCQATVANFSSSPANVNLTVTDPSWLFGLDFSNISAPAQSIRRNDGVQWSGTLSPAIPPQVTGLTDITGQGPAGGYLPLSEFGIAPIAGTGDETISNVSVPTFSFGGEPYSTIGVVSNGYVVVGGGDSSDVNYLPQTFPDSAAPNNVVAPFWTDLNTAFGGAIYAGTLDDGLGDSWIVIDYENVADYDGGGSQTFEIWFQTGGPSTEGITISYGPGNAAGASTGANWGAENRDGSSGVNLPSQPLDGSEYSVNLTPPAAGGQQTITYDASSRWPGTYKSVAAMTSNVTPGITQVVQNITVTRH